MHKPYFSAGPAGIDLPLIQYRLDPAEQPSPDTRQIFGADAPSELTRIFSQEYRKHLAGGRRHEDARYRAIRAVNRAGWFKGKGGKWTQLLPDLRNKINVAEAVEQPDGTFVIEGVPIFYPNAVKGADNAYSSADLDQIIKNTNKGVEAGGVRPVLTEGHPDDLQKALGRQLDACGYPVNFRKNKKTKMVECDLIRVKPAYVKRLREEKLPALSAGFARDAHGLNKRIGHVALLGGTSAALQHLPATEYFSASGNSLCFNADTETRFPRKERHMSMSKRQRDTYAALQSAFEAVDAANTAKELGQPDADDRMAEADAQYKSACKSHFDAMQGEEGEMGADGTAAPDSTATGDTPPPPDEDDSTGAYDAMQNAANGGNIAAESPMGGATPAFSSIEDIKAHFSSPDDNANPADAFNALADLTSKLVDTVKVYQKRDMANVNRRRVEKFDAEITDFRRSGRVLPDRKIIEEQRNACFQAADPDKAMDLLLKGYRSLPPQRTPATYNGGNNFFDARDVRPANQRQEKKLTAFDMQGVMVKPLSAEDMAFAALSDPSIVESD